jgi:hypothetical protein
MKVLPVSVLPLCLLIFLDLPAAADVCVITDTNDTTQSTSLRGAVLRANAKGGENTIILGSERAHGREGLWAQQWIFHLTIPGADEDAGWTGDLDIWRGHLTIRGACPNVIIDAGGLGDRVFQVFTQSCLTLENLTITGGTAPISEQLFFGGEPGGAVYNAGTLILRNCCIIGNSSGSGGYLMGNAGGTSGGDGGGVFNCGTLLMENCVLARNACGGGFDGAFGGSGGGLRNDGTCFLSYCVLSQNIGGDGGAPSGNVGGIGGDGGNGGAIYNSGRMTLEFCRVSSNSAGQASSGAQVGGTVNAHGAPGGWGGHGGDGGGIYSLGSLVLNYCTLDGNSSGNGGSGGRGTGRLGWGGAAGSGGAGAGICNLGTLVGNTCTLSGNRSGNGGDGGLGFGGGAALGAVGGSGGGILNSGSTLLTSCTVVLNEAGAGGDGGNSTDAPAAADGGPGGSGGGICNESTNASLVLRNTLVALNSAGNGGAGGTNVNYPVSPGGQQTEDLGNPGAAGSGPDLAGTFSSEGYNLIGMADGSSGLLNGIKADLVGTVAWPLSPMLGPLQVNGGFTPTHALLPGSPAIDQGNNFGVHIDQRGFRRPYKYTSVPGASGGNGTDIGAFEAEPVKGGPRKLSW